MVRECLRLALLLAASITSLHVAAAPRFWILTDVRFSDPEATAVTGYFGYDDATQTLVSWNIHVGRTVAFPPFTYTSGNSTPSTSQGPSATSPTLTLSVALGKQVLDDTVGGRRLQITPLVPLDGSVTSVPLNFLSKEEFQGGDPSPPLSFWRPRLVATGSLALATSPPPVATAQVDEYYHSSLRHYFISADATEKQKLDSGVYAGWSRTGESFKAYAAGSYSEGSSSPVCRFYSPPVVAPEDVEQAGADSHFFSADAVECMTVFRKDWWMWNFEHDNAFQIGMPDRTSGTCPGGAIPVYRVVSPADSNHRYTTSTAIRTQMIAAGYVAEGYGPDGVVMCALQ